MYSRLFLGLLVLVAIVPLDATVTAPTLSTTVGCSSNNDCAASTAGVTSNCCTLASIGMPISSSLLSKLPASVCAPPGSACCSTKADCITVAAAGQTVVNGYCCQSPRICVEKDTACNALLCNANKKCTDSTQKCCTTTAAVTGLGTSASTPASGVCLPSGIATDVRSMSL